MSCCYFSPRALTCFLGPDFAGGPTGLPSAQDVAGYNSELIVHPGREAQHLGGLGVALDVGRICKAPGSQRWHSFTGLMEKAGTGPESFYTQPSGWCLLYMKCSISFSEMIRKLVDLLALEPLQILCAPLTPTNAFIAPGIVLPILQGCRLSASPANSLPTLLLPV